MLNPFGAVAEGADRYRRMGNLFTPFKMFGTDHFYTRLETEEPSELGAAFRNSDWPETLWQLFGMASSVGICIMRGCHM